MKKTFLKPVTFFGVIGLFILGGCYSEVLDLDFDNLKLEWNPELATPLVDSEFTLEELLEADSYGINYYSDEDNTLVITLSEDSLFSSFASDYYVLQGQSIDVPPVILTPQEIDLFNANGQVTVNREVAVNYPIQEGLTEILINSGNLALTVNENFPADMDFGLGIVDPYGSALLDYNNTFDYVSGGDPASIDQSANPFSNVRFKFDGDPSLSQLSLRYNLTLTRVDQDLVFGNNTIDLGFNFNNLQFGALYGDLSPQDVSTESNTINTDFFNQDEFLSQLDYEFQNPRFKIIFTNSMGVPVQFDVANFTTYRNGVGSEEPINDPIILSAATQGNTVTNEAEFNESFKTIINDVPDSVTLAINGTLDPNNTPDNFVLNDSYIQVGYEIEIPLDLKLSGLQINEVIALESIDPAGLQYAIFKFTSTNSLPLDLEFKADFLSADSTVLGTLFDGNLLQGGTVGAPNTISDFITIGTEGEDLQFLNQVTRIGITATVATTGNDFVLISTDASVKFNLAVQAQYTVASDDF